MRKISIMLSELSELASELADITLQLLHWERGWRTVPNAARQLLSFLRSAGNRLKHRG